MKTTVLEVDAGEEAQRGGKVVLIHQLLRKTTKDQPFVPSKLEGFQGNRG